LSRIPPPPAFLVPTHGAAREPEIHAQLSTRRAARLRGDRRHGIPVGIRSRARVVTSEHRPLRGRMSGTAVLRTSSREVVQRIRRVACGSVPQSRIRQSPMSRYRPQLGYRRDVRHLDPGGRATSAGALRRVSGRQRHRPHHASALSATVGAYDANSVAYNIRRRLLPVTHSNTVQDAGFEINGDGTPSRGHRRDLHIVSATGGPSIAHRGKFAGAAVGAGYGRRLRQLVDPAHRRNGHGGAAGRSAPLTISLCGRGKVTAAG